MGWDGPVVHKIRKKMWGSGDGSPQESVRHEESIVELWAKQQQDQRCKRKREVVCRSLYQSQCHQRNCEYCELNSQKQWQLGAWLIKSEIYRADNWERKITRRLKCHWQKPKFVIYQPHSGQTMQRKREATAPACTAAVCSFSSSVGPKHSLKAFKLSDPGQPMIFKITNLLL